MNKTYLVTFTEQELAACMSALSNYMYQLENEEMYLQCEEALHACNFALLSGAIHPNN